MIKRLLFGFDPVEREKQRAAFMDNPPPCGAFVSYAQNTDDHHGEFIFKASDVVLAATKIIEERSNLVGMHATLRWLGQRDESNREPTSVPKILIHFDHIVHELIALRRGQARCQACNQFFSAESLDIRNQFVGSSGMEFVMCPEGRSLFSYEVIHVFWRRLDK